MKIIISPSKTQHTGEVADSKFQEIPFPQKTATLLEKIRHFSKDQIAQKFHIRGNLLDQIYSLYQNYNDSHVQKGWQLYEGLVFKQLNWEAYNHQEMAYANQHLCVLSALYGVVTPQTGVRPYRLDMKCNILNNENLYDYWRAPLAAYFDDDDPIINLASSEFSKLLRKPMITIAFKEAFSPQDIRTVGTYAKMARGMMVDYLIKNQIKAAEDVRGIVLCDYHFSEQLSTDKHYIFVRSH